MGVLRTADGKEVGVPEVAPPDPSFAKMMAAPAEEISAPPTHDKPLNEKPDTSSRVRKARVAKEVPAKPVKPPKLPVPKKDSYAEDLQPYVQGAFVGLAQFDATKHLAYVVAQSSDQLIAALDEGCKQNEEMRRFVTQTKEKVWWLPLALVGLSMGKAALVISKDPALKKQAAEATDQRIAAMVQSQMTETPDADSNA